jgi:hypothetical protein
MALSDRRRLGTESGRLRRLARQTERSGGSRKAVDSILMSAAEAKMGEGSAITSAEGNDARDQYERRLNRGLNTLAMRSLVSQAGGPAAPAPATSQPTPTASSPAPGRATSATPATVQREGRIDGRPASEVNRRVATPAPAFGADIARRNLDDQGLDGAVADYRRRADAADSPTGPGPGNMQEAAARDASRYTFSPLQQALLNARAQRISATDETAPAPEIAGPPASAANPRPAPEIAGPPASAANRRPSPTMDLTQERPGTPLTVGQAINRDAGRLAAGIGEGGRRLGQGIAGAVRTGANLARATGDGMADEAINFGSLASRAGSALIPGQTGEAIRGSLQRRLGEQRASARRALRRITPPNLITGPLR